MRVVDSTGRPRARLPVRVSFEATKDWHADSFAGATDARGELAIDEPFLAAVEFAARERAEPTTTLFVSVPSIGLPSPTQTIAFEHAMGSTVTLTVPPSGTVSARVLDAQRRVVDQRVDVTLQLLDGGDDAMACDSWVNWLLHPISDVRFGPLALGRQFKVRGETANTTELPEQTVAGPVRDGEDVVVEWVLPTPCSFVSGRILRPNGAPASNTTFQFRLVGPRDEEQRVNDCDRLRTDHDGRFRIARFDLADKTAAALWLDELDERGFTPCRAVANNLPLRLVHGENDAGTLQLVELPLLLRFRIHPPSGERHRTGSALASLEPLDWPENKPMWYGGGDEILWIRRQPPGFDEFRGFSEVARFAVQGIGRDHQPSERIVVPRGTTDLELTLGPPSERAK